MRAPGASRGILAVTMQKPPRLVWTKLDSTYESGEATDHFWGARVPAGWLVWNRLNHTMAFVPDASPPASGANSGPPSAP